MFIWNMNFKDLPESGLRLSDRGRDQGSNSHWCGITNPWTVHHWTQDNLGVVRVCQQGLIWLIVKLTLDVCKSVLRIYSFVTFFDFLSEIIVLKTYFFAGILKFNDENSRIRIH
jgi:hypothetical protein